MKVDSSLNRMHAMVEDSLGRFGFYQQCKKYYNDEGDVVWNAFMSACDCLPICAVVTNSVFAIHAGLSPLLHNLRDIDSIDRFQEIPSISFSYHPIQQFSIRIFFQYYIHASSLTLRWFI